MRERRFGNERPPETKRREIRKEERNDKPFRHRTLEERFAEYGGKFEPVEEFDWGPPVGREIW